MYTSKDKQYNDKQKKKIDKQLQKQTNKQTNKTKLLNRKLATKQYVPK